MTVKVKKLRWRKGSLHNSRTDRPPGPAPGGRRFDLSKMDLVQETFREALRPEAENSKLIAACNYFAYVESRR